MRKPLLWFAFAAVPVTVLCLGMYVVGQQIYRQSANDPQIQMAEDGAARLNASGVPAELVVRGASLVDLAVSASPWIGVYDAAGTPLETSARLDNAPPKPPAGLFDVNAPAHIDDPVWTNGEYRVTWQPRTGVRQALVIVQAESGYFVVAGKSLRLSEERTHQLGLNMLFGWFGALLLTLLWSFVISKFARRA